MRKPEWKSPTFLQFEILVKVKWRNNENAQAFGCDEKKNIYESNNYYELSYVLRCIHMFDS